MWQRLIASRCRLQESDSVDVGRRADKALDLCPNKRDIPSLRFPSRHYMLAPNRKPQRFPNSTDVVAPTKSLPHLTPAQNRLTRPPGCIPPPYHNRAPCQNYPSPSAPPRFRMPPSSPPSPQPPTSPPNSPPSSTPPAMSTSKTTPTPTSSVSSLAWGLPPT